MEANSCGSSSSLSHAINGPGICREEQKRSCSDLSVSDGYNWRKYGEKQVKGSENPRSYYKCTNPNCSMRKKVERNLEGEITEIVYNGSHNHPKPQACGRKSMIQSMASEVYSSTCANSVSRISDTAMREDCSVSVGEEDCFERTSQSSHSGGDEDDFGPQGKRWKGDKNENDGDSSRSVKEPRVVVQTISEIDLLDDGYRWRKYGQKVVKTNPNPRSYYKCTSQGCGVRKLVERAANDAKAVITTYEGKHNHDVPPSRRRSLGYNTSTTSLDGNNAVLNPIRPSANYSTFTNSLHSARPLPTYPNPQKPFALEMFHNQTASLGFSGFGRSTNSDTDQAQEDTDTKNYG